MTSFGGANPEQTTPDAAANFGPLSEWASASRTDWLGGVTQQITSIATQFVAWPLAIINIASTADGDLGQMVIDALTGIPQGIVATGQAVLDMIVNAFGFGSGSGHGLDILLQALNFIPGGNIASFIAAAIVPGLDASKIVSGQFPLGMLDGLLDTFGTIFPDLIGGLDASKIISGQFPLTMVSGLVDILDDLPVIGPFIDMLNLRGFIPVGSVADTQPNLLRRPDFADAVSIRGLADWSYDGTVGRTALGSAKTTALTGKIRELASNEIGVAPGQELSLSVWARWLGLSYTGTNPIRLGLAQYSKNPVTGYATRGTTVWLSSPAEPVPASQSAWVNLTGSYTVPSTGVDEVRMVLRVEPSANAGDVWFDDGEVKKTGLLQQGWVSGLPQSLQDIAQTFEDIIDGIGNVFRVIPIFGSTIANMIDELTDFFLGTEDTAAIASDAKSSVTVTRSSVVTNIAGTPVSDPADAEVDQALLGQTDVVANLSKRIALLEGVNADADASTIVVTDTFEYSASAPDSSVWSLSSFGPGAGTVRVDGHDLYWDTSGGGYKGIFGRYIGPDAVATSDLPAVQMTLGKKTLPSNQSTPSYFYVFTCANSAMDTYVYARVSRTTVRLFVVVSGTETEIGNASLASNPGVGANVELIPYADHTFDVKINNATYNFDDTGNISVFGSSNRYRGWGLQAGVTVAFGAFVQAGTASIGLWSSRNT